MTMQPITPDTPGCGVILMAGDAGSAWRCCQPDCDGEHHYFRKLMWLGPFLAPEDEPSDA